VKNKEMEYWQMAGEIAGRVLKEIAKIVKRGTKLLEICEKSEKLIEKYGGKPAFPTNVSINSIAAHYTSPPGDTKIVENSSIVKIDIGAHVNGYIGDTALSVYVGSPPKVIRDAFKAAQDALNNAISIAKEGVRVGELSNAIYSTAHSYGFGVLKDLNGHEIKRYKLHAGLTIPNIPKFLDITGLGKGPKLKEGMVIAIEPFIVVSQDDSYTTPLHNMTFIYSLKEVKSTNNGVYLKLFRRFRTLPFALRWLVKTRAHVRRVEKIFYRLEKEKLLHGYPTLQERRGKLVIQFEHTIFIKKSSADVLTYAT